MELFYTDNPLLALMPKKEDFGGRHWVQPLVYGTPQGRSATFSKAQSRGKSTSSLITDFVITRAKDYSIATIDNETLEASKGNANAFMDAAITEIDGAILALKRSLAIAMYRGTDGSIGNIFAAPAASVGQFEILLTSPSDVTNFENGQNLVIHSAAVGGSQRTSNGTINTFAIKGINRSSGKLTLVGTVDGANSITAGDFIFVDGDRGEKMSGLLSWLPRTDPTSNLFFNVDRSLDVTRLGGVRYDGSDQPIEEALTDAANLIGREGGSPDYCFLKYEKYAELVKALGSKVQYVDVKMENTKIGFRGISIIGPKGDIKVMPDQNAIDGVGFMLQMNTWKLATLGKPCRVLNTDGLTMLRQNDADGVEVRYGYYGNMGCKAPGYNGILKFN
jgi:hypothetical protein